LRIETGEKLGEGEGECEMFNKESGVIKRMTKKLRTSLKHGSSQGSKEK
jgi:hypothetical protein